MRKLFVLLGLVLTACSSVGNVLPVGVDTYTVSSSMSRVLPSWPEVKAMSTQRAIEFCGSQNKRMTVVGWETHGMVGWSPLDAELTFKCSSQSPTE